MMTALIWTGLCLLVALVCIPIVTALWLGDPGERDW